MVLSSHSSETDSIISNENPDIQASKKRKVNEKMVVTVKIEEKFEGKASRSELGPPPSDCWSWRKYGQKPIKGSPYPRGYYKCSSSKGCLAKKQVERCKTDSSMLIITYTSTHNHSTPNNQYTKESKTSKSQFPEPRNKKEDREEEDEEDDENDDHEEELLEEEQQQPLVVTTSNAECTSSENDFHYCQSPIRSSQDMINMGCHDEVIVEKHLVLEEEPISYPHLMTLSTCFKLEGEENDFYDELEELPMSSSFTTFMRGNFFEDRILV